MNPNFARPVGAPQQPIPQQAVNNMIINHLRANPGNHQPWHGQVSMQERAMNINNL
jgi:hypothetical protein